MQSWQFAIIMFLQIENQDGKFQGSTREWCSKNITTASTSKILLSEPPVLFFVRGCSFKFVLDLVSRASVFSTVQTGHVHTSFIYLPTDFGVLGLQGLGRRILQKNYPLKTSFPYHHHSSCGQF